MLVHGRDLGEHHFGGHQAAIHELRHFREIARIEVAHAFLEAGTACAAEEIGYVTDVLGGARVEIAELAHGENLRNLHIAEVATVLGQSIEKSRGFGYPGWHDDGIAVMDVADGFGRRNALGGVLCLDGHQFFPP